MCRLVCLENVLWLSGSLDLDAVLGGEQDRSRDGCIRWAWRLSKGKWQFGG